MGATANARTQERFNRPVEFLVGFVTGTALIITLIVAAGSILRSGASNSLLSSMGSPASPAGIVLWLATGLAMALLFTGGFALGARVTAALRRQRGADTHATGAVPVTGDDAQDDEDQP